MRILGITGGIATGKSTVTRMLADWARRRSAPMPLPMICWRRGQRPLRRPSWPLSRLRRPWRPAGQTIDRRALGRLIFADPAARARLEALTHPAIIAALQAQIAAWRASDEAQAAAAEIPLLFEAGLERLVDAIVVVACSESTANRALAGTRWALTRPRRSVRLPRSGRWPKKRSGPMLIITTDDRHGGHAAAGRGALEHTMTTKHDPIKALRSG